MNLTSLHHMALTLKLVVIQATFVRYVLGSCQLRLLLCAAYTSFYIITIAASDFFVIPLGSQQRISDASYCLSSAIASIIVLSPPRYVVLGLLYLVTDIIFKPFLGQILGYPIIIFFGFYSCSCESN